MKKSWGQVTAIMIAYIIIGFVAIYPILAEQSWTGIQKWLYVEEQHEAEIEEIRQAEMEEIRQADSIVKQGQPRYEQIERLILAIERLTIAVETQNNKNY